MEHLKSGNFQASLRLLRQAHELLASQPPLKTNDLLAVTLNNMGCFYKKQGKLSLYLQFLQKALESAPSNPSNLAGTHLNICAIRSQMGNHEAALSHAETALGLIEPLGASETLIVTLHNIAAEQEFLSRSSQAQVSYNKAYKLALSSFGENHLITNSIKNSFTVPVSRSLSSSPRHALPRLRQFSNHQPQVEDFIKDTRGKLLMSTLLLGRNL